MSKILYKPLSLVFSVLGGLLAGRVFTQLWKAAAGEQAAPQATDESRTWREVLIAAALHGAVFGLVKAAVDRAGTQGVRKATGHWPANG
ncbi:MAG: hypothetical protein JWN00_1887 [Actinomycetia bacterium]|nr:hypothetical protein [Actinomycetes bacterium]